MRLLSEPQVGGHAGGSVFNIDAPGSKKKNTALLTVTLQIQFTLLSALPPSHQPCLFSAGCYQRLTALQHLLVLPWRKLFKKSAHRFKGNNNSCVFINLFFHNSTKSGGFAVILLQGSRTV